jgi:hypothetical protein
LLEVIVPYLGIKALSILQGISRHPSSEFTMAVSKTMSGILIEKTAGVDTLKWRTDLPVPEPKEGRLQVVVMSSCPELSDGSLYCRTLKEMMGSSVPVSNLTSVASSQCKGMLDCLVSVLGGGV